MRRRADGAGGLRKLPPDLEELAAGRRDSLRPRHRPRGRISDTRVAGLIAGVANHEARRVYDARLERLRAAVAGADEPALERELCVAVLLGLWRARSITGFESFAQDVVGLDHERARTLAERGAAAREVALERLADVAVALWMRSEAALVERWPEVVVDVRAQGERVRLSLELPLAPAVRAADAVAAVGRAAAGLARALSGMPPRGKPA
ncbi:MAG: hypothetical protein ACHP85_24725 [Burkholderiales bacterium]